MKKILALILAAVMMLSFVACSESQTTEGNGAASEPASAESKSGETAATSEAASAAASTATSSATSAAASAAASGTENFDPAGKKIGYIIYSNANESAYMYYSGLEKLCKDAGIEVLSTESNGDAESMMSACDNFILQGVDAIVDSSWNAGGGSSLVKKCNDAGIPLISIDVYYEGDNSYFVGVNNEAVGVVGGDAAAKWAKKKFGDKLDYVVVTYSASLESINARTTSALQGVRDAGYDIPDDHYFQLEIGTGDTTQLAKQQMTDWLTAHPEGTMVSVTGNAEAALGFESAIESQNRGDDCIIVSSGYDTAAKSAIGSGDKVWCAAVDYMGLHYGDTAYPLLLKLLAGERPTEKFWYVQTRFVDSENYAEVGNEQ